MKTVHGHPHTRPPCLSPALLGLLRPGSSLAPDRRDERITCRPASTQAWLTKGAWEPGLALTALPLLTESFPTWGHLSGFHCEWQ